MAASAYSMISSGVSTFLFGMIFLSIARQRQKKYMQEWGICWIVYSLMFLIDFISAVKPVENIPGLFYGPLRQFCILMGSALFLRGTQHFFLKKQARLFRIWLALSFCGLGLSLISYDLYKLTIVPNMLFSSGLLIFSACIFISHYWTRNLPEKIFTSFLIILWAIFVNHYGFSHLYPGIALFNYFAGAAVVNLLVIYFLIIHFKKMKYMIGRQAERFRLLVENASDSMFLYSYEKRGFEYVSPSMERLLGVSRENLTEMPERFFDHIETGENEKAILNVFSRRLTGPAGATLCYLKEGAPLIWSEMHCMPIYDSLGRVAAVEGIMRDVTERKKMEESLKASEAARKELIENLSHEIKTPVTLIRGYAESLLDQVVPDASRKSYYRMILSKTTVLLTLLEDLIRVSEFTSQTLTYRFYETDAELFFGRVMEQAAAQIRAAGRCPEIRIEMERGVAVIIDRARIDQVVTNLTGNSIRYTPVGGTLTLSCRTLFFDRQEGKEAAKNRAAPRGEVIFSVSDTGCGIDEKELPMIFNRNFRGRREKAEDRSEGSGLGLFISKEIVGQHSGRIHAENNSAGGATVSFAIPCYESEE